MSKQKIIIKKSTLDLASALTTRVIGRMLSALGMKRRRETTAPFGRDATWAGLSSSSWPLETCPLKNTLDNRLRRLPVGGSVCCNVCLLSESIPEGQLQQLGPHLLSVEAERVLLSHALRDVEARSDQAHHVAV